jgi:hypothetical protein
MKRWTIALAPLLLGTCTSAISGSQEETLAGHYSQGFEVDAFRPCGSEERWWVTEGEELRARYRALAPGQYQEVYVELKGHTGPTGKYGHLGAYTRELSAGEVIEIRPSTDRDCG